MAITVNSLSGGKTSSYMAVHYPADYEIFALVTVEDKDCLLKDKGLTRYAEKKLQDNFTGTVEQESTLKVMYDLEQKIGRNIHWIKGKSFDSIIKYKKALPNPFKRFCTIEMKLKPIFDFWLQNIGEVVDMRIGFRYDEFERSLKFTKIMKYAYMTSLLGQKRKKWKETYWRNGEFPLIDNKVFHSDVTSYWEKTDFIFPTDSNCVGCFWKSPQQLRKNSEDSPNRFNWFIKKELEQVRTFKKDMTYQKISEMDINLEFNFGGGAGCNAGFCTD